MIHNSTSNTTPNLHVKKFPTDCLGPGTQHDDDSSDTRDTSDCSVYKNHFETRSCSSKFSLDLSSAASFGQTGNPPSYISYGQAAANLSSEHEQSGGYIKNQLY